MSADLERPSGAPLQIEWNGILEGRVADPRAILAAADALSACSKTSFSCEVTGMRFSLLPSDSVASGAGFDEGAQSRFFEALERLVATAVQGSVESTLRSKMVYERQVAETLFAIQRGALTAVTRVRERQPSEGVPLESSGSNARRVVGRREILVLAPLLMLTAIFFAWRNGLMDRVLAARSEQLAIEVGPFGDMLSLTVARKWGNYQVEVRRGAGYPADPVALAALRDGASSLVGRAAVDAVGNGSDAWIHVCNESGEVRATSRFELRALLADPAGKVEVTAHGAIDAKTLRLSLTKEAPGK